MAVITPPIFLQGSSHAADSVRRALGGLVVYRNSIVGSGDWAVTQNGTPNMSVNVAEGRGLVVGTEATYQGGYLCESQGVTNLAITAANATNPRIDLIVARVKDLNYSGALATFSLEVVTGTAAASPVAPATPVDSYVLATIAVGAAVTSIVNANITDNRTTTTSGLLTAAGGVVTCTSTTRPAAPVSGMEIFETDTKRLMLWDGSAWIGAIPFGATGNAYTPTLTNITIGTGGTPINLGRWERMGNWIEAEAVVQLGTTGFSVGTGFTISLPFNMDTNFNQVSTIIGATTLSDATGPLYQAATVSVGVASVETRYLSTATATSHASLGQCSATLPFTWAAGDRITMKARYRAA